MQMYTDLGTVLPKHVTGLAETTGRPYENASLVQKNAAGNYEECYAIGENTNFWSENKAVNEKIIEKAMEKGTVQQNSAHDGCTLYAVAASDTGTPHYAVVVEVPSTEYDARLDAIRYRYMMYGGIFIAGITLCYLLVVLIQNRDIHNMIHIMRRVTEGKEDLRLLSDRKKENRVRSNDMRMLYSGLRQIATDILRVNYEKYKMLQVYYRFAPKDIEKIMGKNSILDVKVNEQVSIEATLAYISFNINERLEQHEQLRDINEYYTKLGRVRKKHGGIIFNSSTDLSTIQMMFNKDIQDAVAFGIALVSEESNSTKDNHAFVLLHRSAFVYGISGDEEQTFAFAHSKEMKIIEKHIEGLRKLGIRMAVTDDVYATLGSEVKCRYIGYVQDEDTKFNLYEILDAYPAKIRQQRINTAEKFAEALQLFYQSDFYFARTLFTEIVKDGIDDDIIKHYIFQCESCLNEERHGADQFSLL